MKATDLREKNAADLQELQKTLQNDVFQNRLKNFTNRLDDTSAIRKGKRDLARVITVLREQAAGIKRAPAPAKEHKAPKPPKAAKPAKVKAAAEPAESAEAQAKPKKAAAKKSSAKKSEAK